MPKKIDEEKHGNWLTTMADMNTLLLTFFVMLFTMLSMEKVRYQRLHVDPFQHAFQHGTQMDKVTPIEAGVAIKLLESYLESNVARENVVNIEGQYTRFMRAQDEVRIQVGGEFDPFAEGDFKLRESHYKILDAVYTWMKDETLKIAVRGYTSRRFQDSVMQDAGGAWRPWDPDMDPDEAADHRTLSYLRARSAADYLIRAGIPPDRLVVQAEGAWGIRRASAEPPPVPKLEFRDDEDLAQRLARQQEAEFKIYAEWQAKDRRVDIVIVDPERR